MQSFFTSVGKALSDRAVFLMVRLYGIPAQNACVYVYTYSFLEGNVVRLGKSMQCIIKSLI